MNPDRRRFLRSLVLVVGAVATSAASESSPRKVEFDRDIRPILSDVCYQCHGPDKAKRKADLRLDDRAAAFADRGGYHAIVPGDTERSELYQRLVSDDETERMPPPDSGKALSPEQVATIRRWIQEGAPWQGHWSLVAPRRPELPPVADARWTRNAIDRFVLARLEAEGLAPSPEADRATLLRRATLDLTGLPPTPAEVDAFLADRSPDAYEKVVDRLLGSPRHGERMASRWLDAARYADTNGYQTDGERQMWRWRDWVIEAYNRKLPFDRFTVEQLAGDLLPGATLDQRIATGFNRNHRGNAEGGIIPEEYAVEYVVDRVDTTSTVWLGLTMLCSRCHDHKYDPIRQEEFYRVFALFNNVPERGKAIKFGNSPPSIKAPTRAQQAQLAALDRRLADAEAEVARLAPALEDAQAAWETTATAAHTSDWTITEGLSARFDFEGSPGGPGTAVEGGPAIVAGILGRAARFDGAGHVEARDVGDFGFLDKFSLAAWVRPEDVRTGMIVSRMADADRGDGYSVALDEGRLQINLVKRWLDDALRVRSRRRLEAGQWHHVAVTYDGSRVAGGVKLYVDGRPEAFDVLLDDLNQSFQSKEPFRVGAGGGRAARLRGELDDLRVYGRAVGPDEAEVLAVRESIEEIVRTPAERRTGGQARKLRAYFLETQAPANLREAHRRSDELRAARERLSEALPTVMVMQEMVPPRKTFLLKRGEYDKPGAEVTPGVPACLPPLPAGVRPDRLAFARWLVDGANPLTARVAVNRHWQMLFGTGLVKTVDDFGSQGEAPRHPALLDWLAVEFQETGWDVPHLLRTILTSATYRQSSRATPESLRKDPENRLLSRGPRLRLSAEMIRDQALAASGLLAERLGGPSVKPYQPAGLWRELTDADYVQDHGAGLYRRSLYTFWKRTVSPPTLATFDAPTRESCVVRETRTNTPLQALTLMNDVTFVEASRVLAQRVLAEGGPRPEDRIALAFRLATARAPTAGELATLSDDLEAHLAHYRHNPEAAARLIAIGEYPADALREPAELAAYTALANLILNLDETITKE